jgi:hypothetical protein
VSAPAPQTQGGVDYGFDSWSDGGAQSHNVVAPATPSVLTAVFHPTPPPSLTVSDVTVTEGDSGSVDAVFTVTLSAPSGKAVMVSYATARGSAREGVDYLPAAGTLTLPAGSSSATITVAVAGDRVRERTETFWLNLGAPKGASILDGHGLGRILDDERKGDPGIR